VAAFILGTEPKMPWKERALNKRAGFFLMILAAAIAARAQSSNDQGPAMMAGPPRDSSPVAEARNHRLWEYGPFVNGGVGLGNRDNFEFFSLGFQLGKPITPVIHAGIFSGQFELAGNIMPFWQAYTPAPHNQTFIYSGKVYTEPIGGGTYTGSSITPVVFRWNFLTRSHRFQPWFQAAGGLIYTTHKFPPDVLVPHGQPGGTSVWNFSPQGGAGFHYFTRPRRSIDFQVNAVHISSASLGDHNPGVNASIQMQLGYTWWK
jgi:lipid A 3-O-deacylase